MGFFSNLFKSSKQQLQVQPIYVDMHSHLLPAIDDGSKNMQETFAMIERMKTMGYQKIITTPHIMGDYYKNTPETIGEKLNEVKKHLYDQGLEIELEAAAEYYVDESLVKKLKSKEKLLTFGDNYLLIETSYLNEPSNFAEVIMLIKENGYWPILAHPERYQYLYVDFEKYERLYALDISFQLNINSVGGYYGKQAKFFAKKLIDKSMIGFIGSDCHSMKHLDVLEKTRETEEYAQLSNLYLFNNSLL
jgi:tyrosine-protein phosphatase YwqE